MEPLSSAAIAIATIILTKTLEKPGEKLGEVLTNQIGRLLNLVRQKSLPQTQSIEQGNPDANFNGAVQELETNAASDPELGQVLKELAAEVEKNPQLCEQVKQVAGKVIQNPSLIVNNSKLAEEIKYLFQGGTFINPTFQ